MPCKESACGAAWLQIITLLSKMCMLVFRGTNGQPCMQMKSSNCQTSQRGSSAWTCSEWTPWVPSAWAPWARWAASRARLWAPWATWTPWASYVSCLLRLHAFATFSSTTALYVILVHEEYLASTISFLELQSWFLNISGGPDESMSHSCWLSRPFHKPMGHAPKSAK